jgi:hypothetical protein
MHVSRWMGSVVFVMGCITLISAPFLSMGAVAEFVPCRTAQPLKDAQASVVLAEQRPFEPQNRNLFFTYGHPDWASVAPPKELPGPALDEQATREELRVFLERRFPCAATRFSAGWQSMAIRPPGRKSPRRRPVLPWQRRPAPWASRRLSFSSTGCPLP